MKFRLTHILFLILTLSNLAFSQNEQVDSLLAYIKTAKSDTNKINALNDVSKLMTEMGSVADAKTHAENAQALANKLNFKKGIASAENNLGVIYETQGNYIEAHKHHEIALKIRTELKDNKGIAASLNNIGNLYSFEGRNEDALKNYNKALELKKKYGTKKSLINAYNNIGIIYLNMLNLPKALEYFKEALKISEELKNERGLSNAYTNIGLVYEDQKNFPEALNMFNKVLELSEKTGNKVGIAASNVNLSSVSIKLHQIPQAKKYCEEALKISKEIGNTEFVKQCYANFVKLDSAMGNERGQLENLKLFHQFQDSLTNADNFRKMNDRQIEFDFARKATADSIKNAEKIKLETLKHNREIKEQKYYTYGGIIGFLLMIVISGISFRAFRQKRKANDLIRKQKEILEEKQKEILDSIHYAKRIQQSLLPSERYIDKSLKRLHQ